MKILSLFVAVLLCNCNQTKNHKSFLDDQPDFKSSSDCHNQIKIWVRSENQYEASLASDIPIYNKIRFAGYCLDENEFLIFRDFSGMGFSLKKSPSGKYIRTDMSLDECRSQGWEMERHK